jgi:hypothetical protein
MPLTPITGTVPYCTVAQAVQFWDVRVCADLCNDSDVTATVTPANIGTNPIALLLMSRASGRIDSACSVANRYQPSDLAKLVATGGTGADFLSGMVADLWFGALVRRRPDKGIDVPKEYEEAERLLEQLRHGELIYGFVEAETAGNIQSYEILATQLAENQLSTFTARRALGTRNGFLRRGGPIT